MSNPWFDLTRDAYQQFQQDRVTWDRDDAIPAVAAEIRERGLADAAVTELAYRLLKSVDHFMSRPPVKDPPDQLTLEIFTDEELQRMIVVDEGSRTRLEHAHAAEADVWVKHAEQSADRVATSATSKRRRLENLRPWLDQGMTVGEATREFNRGR